MFVPLNKIFFFFGGGRGRDFKRALFCVSFLLLDFFFFFFCIPSTFEKKKNYIFFLLSSSLLIKKRATEREEALLSKEVSRTLSSREEEESRFPLLEKETTTTQKRRSVLEASSFLEETLDRAEVQGTTTSIPPREERESNIFLGKKTRIRRGDSKKRLYFSIMGNTQKSGYKKKAKRRSILNIRHMARRKKMRNSGKRRQPDTAEQVKTKCTSGRLGENARKLIQEAVDAFRTEVEKQKVEIGGQRISAKDFAGIVKALRDAKLIPEDAEVLDFPTKQTGENLDATPWIGIFEGETDIAADIHYNHRLGGNGTTLVYVVECEKEPQIEYWISGRKKGEANEKDAYHVEEVNGAGSWLWFPSKNYHFHKGAKRTIISLIFLSEEEEEEEEEKKKNKVSPRMKRVH